MSARQEWVGWWVRPWLNAHPDWWPDSLKSLSGAQCQRLSYAFHESIAVEFGITPTPVEMPTDVLASLVLANDERLQLITRLCWASCYPRREVDLEQAHTQWCLRLAKGVRPGRWLPDEGNPLRLLQEWMNADQWQRFRLRLPLADVQAVENTALSKAPPDKQLTTLWTAIVWQAAQ